MSKIKVTVNVVKFNVSVNVNIKFIYRNITKHVYCKCDNSAKLKELEWRAEPNVRPPGTGGGGEATGGKETGGE